MLDLAFKNIRKQKTRTILTVVGIVIGITAIVALGSFAEGINAMIEQNLGSLSGSIVVSQAGSGGIMTGFSGSDVTQEQLDNIKSVSGVDDAVPVLLYMPASHGFGGAPWIGIGMDVDKIGVVLGKSIRMSEGGLYSQGERDVAVVGDTVAESLNVKVGDYFQVKDRDFLVTGVIEKAETEYVDSGVFIPLEDMQPLLGKESSYQAIFVVPDNPQQVEAVADEINSQDDTLSAMTSKDMARQVSDIINNVRIFTVGVGAIAAFVGGLGVMNTMIMAVLERRKEIGVMKAVGATRRFLLVQIITESAAISLIGGLVGLFLGWVISISLSLFTGGAITGIVTPGLALGSLAFALALGIFGGLYPAWQAARLDPVEALRG
jgi:putative ABC transport system permease protein